MQKWYELWFQKTLFLSEHAACICYQSKCYLQVLKQQSTSLEWRHITSFYFINESCFFCFWKKFMYELSI